MPKQLKSILLTEENDITLIFVDENVGSFLMGGRWLPDHIAVVIPKDRFVELSKTITKAKRKIRSKRSARSRVD